MTIARWKRTESGVYVNGRHELRPLKTGQRVTGWALFVNGEYVDQRPTLRSAKVAASRHGGGK